jgi:hypothetical protein
VPSGPESAASARPPPGVILGDDRRGVEADVAVSVEVLQRGDALVGGLLAVEHGDDDLVHGFSFRGT